MADAKAYQEAAALLRQAQQLLGDAPEAGSCGHLARACRIRGVMLDATVVVDLPVVRPERFTVRQDPETGAVTMIHRETGEKRTMGVVDFASLGDVEHAWRVASG